VKKRRLALIIGFVFIELLGYSLFLPLLPFYAGSLGASPALIGLLIASNAMAQFLAAPLIGRLSDTWGRRPMLLFSIVGTAFGFVLLALIEPLGRWTAQLTAGRLTMDVAALGWLFFSRILDGFAGGNVSLARAYITDITDERNRARGLGLIGAAFGTGFIIGPALGGTLSNWPLLTQPAEAWGLSRYAVPAFAALALSALNFIGVALWLPESLTPERRAKLADRERAILPIRALREALERPRVRPLLQTRFFYSFAFTMFTANFALYTRYRFGLTDQSTSYILTYVGVLVVLVQGFIVGRLADRFPEKSIIVVGVAVLAVALLGWALAPNVGLVFGVLALLALSGGTLNTVTNSALTKAVREEDVGGTLGLSTSLDSLTQILAPIIGGFLIDELGPWAVGATAALTMAGVVFYAWRCLVVNATQCWDEEPQPQDVAPEVA
jgi:DHA1 family tetracycline resistance protein-like MFS transporter